MLEPYQSAFEQDEARRKEAETQAALNRSIAAGRKPVPEQGLSSGAARAELTRFATEDRAKVQRNEQEEAARHVDVRDVTHVIINPPHKALTANGELALDIKFPPPAAAVEPVAIPNHPFRILDASVTSTMKVKAYVNSLLFDTTDFTGAGVTITDLTTEMATGIGFVDYLEITLDGDLAVTDVTRKNASGGWTGYGAMFHVNDTDPDNPFVDKIYVKLAEVVDEATEATGLNRDGTTITDGTDTARIIQLRKNHIYLEPQRAAAAAPILMPVSAN